MRSELFIVLTFVLAGILFFIILAFIHYHGKLKREEERAKSLCKEIDAEKSNTKHKEDEILGLKDEINQMKENINSLNKRIEVYSLFYQNAKSNLTLFPYMAGIISEFETEDIEDLARKLDWGHSTERAKKVASIRMIRKEAQEKINQAILLRHRGNGIMQRTFIEFLTLIAFRIAFPFTTSMNVYIKEKHIIMGLEKKKPLLQKICEKTGSGMVTHGQINRADLWDRSCGIIYA